MAEPKAAPAVILAAAAQAREIVAAAAQAREAEILAWLPSSPGNPKAKNHRKVLKQKKQQQTTPKKNVWESCSIYGLSSAGRGCTHLAIFTWES